MRVGIIADTHHNETNYSQVLQYLRRQEIPILIHCGDWDRPGDVRAIAEGFSGQIYGVLGNIDTECEEMFAYAADAAHLDLVKDTQIIEIDGRTAAVNHYPEQAEPLVRTGNYDAVFHGHTHRSRTLTRGAALLANPGNVAGRFASPSFGLWDTGTNRFEIVPLASLRSS